MPITRMEVGLDWFQASVPQGTITGDELDHFAHELRRAEEQAGYLAKTLSIHGYFGWSVGSVALLRHETKNRVMIKVSGDLAGAHAAYLASIGVEQGVAVTRVDLQATIWYTMYIPGVADELADRVAAVRQGRQQPRVTYINGKGAGDTTYIGAPSSDKRIRIYDKYKESGGDDDYRWAWRYEVQYRSSYGQQVLKQIAEGINIDEIIAGIINAEFEPYGHVVVPEVRVVQKPQGRRRDSDIDRRRQWLKNQVGPAARELAYTDGWDTILELLKGD